jgi:hypothetical protein
VKTVGDHDIQRHLRDPQLHRELTASVGDRPLDKGASGAFTNPRAVLENGISDFPSAYLARYPSLS